MPKPTDVLATKPEQLRGPIIRGFAAAPAKADEPVIERDGGYKKAGILRGYAVISRAEALGHGMWVDGEMLSQVTDALNKAEGVKSRFTHPGLSSDGMGKQLGRSFNARLDGDVVRADLHFIKSAHKTPQGDLAEYVMSLAEETPQDFGASIVFSRDVEAEVAFMTEHGAKVLDAEWGEYDLTDFESPDPLNEKNLPHVRLRELHAADVVDEPAANPSGMFGREQQIPVEADALVAYALGLSDERPEVSALGIDPDRLRGFASRFLSYRGLSVVSEKAMSKSKQNLSAAVAEPPVEETVAETPQEEPVAEATEAPTEPVAEAEGQEPAAQDETQTEATGDTATEPVAETPAETPAEQPSAALSARQELARFTEAFGVQDGSAWFAEGIDYATALGRSNEKLRAEVASLQNRLTAALAAVGEETPVSFTPADSKPAAIPQKYAHLSPGAAAYAAELEAKRQAG